MGLYLAATEADSILTLAKWLAVAAIIPGIQALWSFYKSRIDREDAAPERTEDLIARIAEAEVRKIRDAEDAIRARFAEVIAKLESDVDKWESRYIGDLATARKEDNQILLDLTTAVRSLKEAVEDSLEMIVSAIEKEGRRGV